MESSIAVFLKRWQACELPPTHGVARLHPPHTHRLAACAGVPLNMVAGRLRSACARGWAHGILAEGAIALSVTLSGGALFAS